MFRIVLAHVAIILNRIVEAIYYFFEPIPKLNKFCKKLCIKITKNTDNLLTYYTNKTTVEIAGHLKAVHKLKMKAEIEGDIFTIAKYNREQTRIKQILFHNGITNIALNGTIIKERK